MQHDLAGLVTIRELREECELRRNHTLEVTDRRRVGLRVLRKIITAIEHTLDSGDRIIRVVQALVLQVEWHPAAVDHDSLLLSLSIQVGVEGSHNVDAFLPIAHLLDSILAGVIEDAADLDGPH